MTEEAEASGPPPVPGPPPVAGHAVLLAGYGGLVAAATVLARRRRVEVDLPSGRELVLLALATEHLARLITKDSITSIIRKPFARYVEPAGEGEVNEEVIGTGLRHSIGELITCPFCVAQWVATGLVIGKLCVPRFTDAAVTVCAAARLSDHLQLLYAISQAHQGQAHQ